MDAAQTKGRKEDKHTGMQEKKMGTKKRKTKSMKQGTEASKQENRTQGVSISSNLAVSATKPRRGPCHTIYRLIPALVGNGIKCHFCRCRASPPLEQIDENKKKCLDKGVVATEVPLISRTGILPHDLPFHF